LRLLRRQGTPLGTGASTSNTKSAVQQGIRAQGHRKKKKNSRSKKKKEKEKKRGRHIEPLRKYQT